MGYLTPVLFIVLTIGAVRQLIRDKWSIKLFTRNSIPIVFLLFWALGLLIWKAFEPNSFLDTNSYALLAFAEAFVAGTAAAYVIFSMRRP